jgi:asparagine synthase (glutamine-hydrolysing)
MCGIAGAINLRGETVPDLTRRLDVMGELIAHRGPDDHGAWSHPHGHVGFAHRRLSIFDTSSAGHQPMEGPDRSVVTYNGEVYNWPELRTELGEGGGWRTRTDTEVLLRAHEHWGRDAVDHLRGMFAYGLWDERNDELLLIRDRFGIKPLYYAQVGDVLYFASEAKALLPFLPSITTDPDGLSDYLAFQFCLAGKTLFQGVSELQPGHRLVVRNGTVTIDKYWEVYYDLDWGHREAWFEERVEALLHDSVRMHLRSDVPVGAYVSGGLDSSAVAGLASIYSDDPIKAFVGRFTEGPEYDESRYARIVAEQRGLDLSVIDIGVDSFTREIEKVLYHLDFPVAGPGSFPQFMVSEAASRDVKVILGGQGGDEIFGGYTRYLIAYFEQCIKAAIDGTTKSGNFVVTYESIIPQLASLRSYKPLLQQFWKDGLFGELDERYFRLINRAPDVGKLVKVRGDYDPFLQFSDIFNGSNVGHQSYFDKMTHFDFKTLLPALLQVEDRVSMAHGLESRVPLLDHPLVELAATIPADVKFPGGKLKHVFARATRAAVPQEIQQRTDKMGFPVPLVDWARGPAREYVGEVFSTDRELFDNRAVLDALDGEAKFGRTFWGLFSLELWQQRFHDRESEFQALLTTERTIQP